MFGELIHRIRYLAPTVSQWRSEALIARIFGSEPYPFWRNLRAYFSPHYGMRFAGPDEGATENGFEHRFQADNSPVQAQIQKFGDDRQLPC